MGSSFLQKYERKNAYIPEGGNEGGREATPPSISIFKFFKSMCPKDGQNRIAIPKTAQAKARGQKSNIEMLVGVAFLPPSFPSSRT